MARTFRALAVVSTMSLFGVASGGAASHDARDMTPAERAVFRPLACQNARYDAKLGAYHCTRLNRYPGAPHAVRDFGLSTIAYGGFTRAGADEAFVSYSTLDEPHAHNFGGGILFEHAGSAWKLVRWYPGRQLEQCVALEGNGPQRMLCLSHYEAQGVVNNFVAVRSLDQSVQRVLQVDDMRGMPPFLAEQRTSCGKPASYAPKVRDVDTLTRSAKPGYFAESKVSYSTAAGAYRACTSGTWGKDATATVYYALKNGRVTFVSPLPIEQSAD